MFSELIICPKCRTEIELKSGDNWTINELSIVSQEKCQCIQKQQPNKKAMKPLDQAFKRMQQDEINLRSTSKVSNSNESSGEG